MLSNLFKGLTMSQITYKQFRTACDTVKEVWKESKLFANKADKQSLLIINSKATYATIINTEYILSDGQPDNTLERAYSKQFAQDVTSRVMQELLLG